MLILVHIMQIKMNKCIIYKITEKGDEKRRGKRLGKDKPKKIKKFPADKAGEKRDAKTGRINPDESDGLAFAFFSRRQRRSRKACRRRF